MLKSLRKAVLILFALTFILVATLVVNALRQPSVQVIVPPVDVQLHNGELATILSQAVQIATVSRMANDVSPENTFVKFRQFLRERFPLVHANLQLEIINQHSLLYTWRGKNATLKPALMLAHYDVVEVEDNPSQSWAHPPFSGWIGDGYVWGRGSLDDKSGLITMLASVEQLLAENHQPQRTLLFAFGHDEEIGGTEGAVKIAELLASRNVKPEFIFDEGMPVTDGVITGANNPVAMIGVAEKGFLNIELSVNTEGGHASSPPTETAVGILARAVTRIESNPMPVHTDGVMSQTFDAISPDMATVQRIALGNRWLLGSLITKQLVAKPSTNATLRTTFAPTMISGSPQPNVLPTRATAVINIRILPGDNVLGALEHIQNAIDDPRVEINIQGQPSEPSKITDANSRSFKLIERTMRELFASVLVAPAQMIATTDSRHYAHLSDHIYRFRPLWIKPDDIKRFHGIDERISIENLHQMTKFYVRFMKNIDTLN